MVCSLQARRRFLLSIIRSPTLSHLNLPLRVPAQSRSLHSTYPHRENVPSITFGSEIDSLLGVKKKAASSKNTLKSKTRRKSPKSVVTAEEVEIVTDSKDEGIKVASEVVSGSAQAPGMSPREGAGVDEEVTLELSEDAYEEISRPMKRASRKSEAHVSGESYVRGTSSRPGEKFGKRSERSAATLAAKVDQNIAGATERLPARPQKKLEKWQVQKEALKHKFGGEGWNPRKKLSPDALEGIRALHEQDSERYSTATLSEQFKVSPEAIRRILKSKWRASPEVMEERRARWARRHDRIWDQKAALGLRPDRKRDRNPEGPEAFEEEVRAKQMLGQL